MDGTDHAIRRARERYGLEMAASDIHHIASLIITRDPRAEFLCDEALHRQRWRVREFGLVFDVIFCPRSAHVVTFLIPPPRRPPCEPLPPHAKQSKSKRMMARQARGRVERWRMYESAEDWEGESFNI